MTHLLLGLLLVSSILAAQERVAGTSSQHTSEASNGEITVEGCVSRSTGDYILMRHDPGVAYQLHATGRIKLDRYLGQQVAVIGKESPSLSTSSNPSGRPGSPSVALTITSIKTIEKRCSAQ